MDSLWISAADALERHDAGEFDLMRVTVLQLKMLADNGPSLPALVAWADSKREFPVHRPVLPPGA